MDIFISGDLTTFAPALVDALLADGHTVVASHPAADLGIAPGKHLVMYTMEFSDSLFPEIFSSHSFDAVIHITDHGFYAKKGDAPHYSANTAELECVLDLTSRTRVLKFILMSSIDVYGDNGIIRENDLPMPTSTVGQILANAENLCRHYANDRILMTIIRTPDVYGSAEKYSVLSNLVRESQKGATVEVPFSRLDHCNFLHIEDLGELIRSVINDEHPANPQIFNPGTEDINYDFLSQQLNLQFSQTKYLFASENEKTENKRKIEKSNAGSIYGWNPRHNIIMDIPDLAQQVEIHPQKRYEPLKFLGAFSRKLQPFLVWLEVIMGAFLMHMLTVWTNTIIEFRVVDYRLLFVVIIGSIHGLLFGIIAAILAAASAIFSWRVVGLDFALLVYNVENWIPFTVYFLAGAVTGYVHDKQANDLHFEKHQTELIHEKYTFLYSLYNEISTIKNRLREQLVGYRDSFGRFFRVANELNDFDEDNLFFKALEILEDLMKNDQIAIYSIESSGHYGRLQVNSKTIRQEIPKSMRLDDYPDALSLLRAGEVYQNKDLAPNYPAYIAPIRNADGLIGVVVIWEAKFEQFNMYYYNLFKVITGLIQSSLVRAATFENTQYEKLYLPGTRIMLPDAFKQTIAIRKKMRRNKVSDFQILRIPRGDLSWEVIYERISMTIRGEDVVGILHENSDVCFVMLANAALDNIGMIQERMKNNGVSAEFLAELEIE